MPGVGRQRFIAATMCEGSRGSNRSATKKPPLTSTARPPERRSGATQRQANARSGNARKGDGARRGERKRQDEGDDVAHGGRHGSTIRRVADRSEQRLRFTLQREGNHRCARPNVKVTGDRERRGPSYGARPSSLV